MKRNVWFYLFALLAVLSCTEEELLPEPVKISFDIVPPATPANGASAFWVEVSYGNEDGGGYFTGVGAYKSLQSQVEVEVPDYVFPGEDLRVRLAYLQGRLPEGELFYRLCEDGSGRNCVLNHNKLSNSFYWEDDNRIENVRFMENPEEQAVNIPGSTASVFDFEIYPPLNFYVTDTLIRDFAQVTNGLQISLLQQNFRFFFVCENFETEREEIQVLSSFNNSTRAFLSEQNPGFERTLASDFVDDENRFMVIDILSDTLDNFATFDRIEIADAEIPAVDGAKDIVLVLDVGGRAYRFEAYHYGTYSKG